MEKAWEFRRAHEGNSGMVLGSSGTRPMNFHTNICQWRLFVMEHDPDVATKWIVVHEPGSKTPQRLRDIHYWDKPLVQLNNGVDVNPLRRRRADSYRLEFFQWIISKSDEELAEAGPGHIFIDPETVQWCVLSLMALADPDAWIERYESANRSHPAFDLWRGWCVDYYDGREYAAQHYLKERAKFERLAEKFEQVATQARDDLNRILAINGALERVEKTDRWLSISSGLCYAMQEAAYSLYQQKGQYEQAREKAREKGVLPEEDKVKSSVETPIEDPVEV